MIRMTRAVAALMILGLLAACGAKQPPSKFKRYDGPPVTQILVKKSERKMYLLSGTQVLKGYKVDLGNQPVGPKKFEGDGRTPEGIYRIDRHNPNSLYHLSVGISYPNPNDEAYAMAFGHKAGSNIMIHGRGPYGNAQKRPDWTAGCIAVTDQEMEDIFAMVQTNVPVVIVP